MKFKHQIRQAVDRVKSAFNLGGPKYVQPTNGLLGVMNGGWAAGQLEAMGSVGTLYAIIQLLSTSTAQVDWHMYRKSPGGRKDYGTADDNRVEVTKHQALAVLDRPNALMTRMELFERTQQYLDLAGESFWLIEKTDVGAIPIGIWPIRPDRMIEVVSEAGLIGWVYRQPDGVRIPYRLDEIVHIKMPNPLNIYRGLSPVHALAVDLESVDASAKYNRNYFRNSAAPSGVIEAPEALGDTEFNRVVMQWSEQHRGVRNAHRVGLLENGLKWVDTTTKMRDMQFVELRNLSRELIREAYGIHKHMLGLADDVNRANALAAGADFAAWKIVPRLERIKQALNSVFLPMFGATAGKVEFDYENPVPEDRESENAERQSKVDAAVKLIDAGGDPEQVLEAMGLPPIEWRKPEESPRIPVPVSPGAPAVDTEDTLSAADLADVSRLLKDVFK